MAALDDLTWANQNFGKMGVTCRKLVTVVNFDQISVLCVIFSRDNDAPRRGNDLCSWIGDEIDAFVKGRNTGDGIETTTKGRANVVT